MPGFWREPEDELSRNRIRLGGRRGSIARAGKFLPGRALRHSGPAGSFGCGTLSAPEACCSCAFFIFAATVQA